MKLKTLLIFSVILLITALLIVLNINQKTNLISKAATTVPSYSNTFFPIGIYYLPSTDVNISWAKIKETKINSLVYGSWHFYDDINKGFDAYFKQAQANNIKVYVVLSDVGNTFTDDYEKCPKSFSTNNSVILSKLLSYPGLTGWYSLDEPYLPDRLPCYSFHDWLINEQNKKGKNLPIWTDFLISVKEFNNNKGGDWKTFVDGYIDIYKKTKSSIVSIDSNMIDSKGQDFGSAVNYFSSSFKKADINAKFWIVLPARSDITNNIKDIRFQVFDSIINGAQGIFWWDWPPGCNAKNCPGYQDGISTSGYSSNWESIKNISIELNTMIPGLTSNITQATAFYRLISWRIFKDSNSKDYVLVSNKSSTDINNVSVTGLSVNKSFQSLETKIVYKTDNRGILQIPSFPAKSAMAFVEQ